MNSFSKTELLLARRAMILLSCVVEGEESKLCIKLAEQFASEYRVRKMLGEDEEIEKPKAGKK